MPPPKPKTLHILCFGDSLTSGFCNFGLDERPYSARLQQRLTAEFPGREIHVYTDGEPGELVLNGSWEARLRADLNKRRYDWVIMLGGTNDLGSVISEDRILEALEDRWAKVLSKGGKLLALTVPECHSRPGWLVERRALLNDDILAHEAPNFYSFDLHSRIPYHSLSREDREKYWDDGLHLTGEGYSWMGDHIADALLPLVKADIDAEKASQKKSSRRSEEETVVFDEEGGNIKDISQGYVIIRKKDLE
ncbi:hypothetical protein V2G26_014497 [Clonostachys chloroleuca]